MQTFPPRPMPVVPVGDPVQPAAGRRVAALSRQLTAAVEDGAAATADAQQKAARERSVPLRTPEHIMAGPFVAKPYVQLSTAAASADGTEQLTLTWHTLDVEEEGGWLVCWEGDPALGRMRRSSGKLRPKSTLVDRRPPGGEVIGAGHPAYGLGGSLQKIHRPAR